MCVVSRMSPVTCKHFIPVATNNPRTGPALHKQSCGYNVPEHSAGYCECSDNIPRFVYDKHGTVNCNFLCGTTPHTSHHLDAAWHEYRTDIRQHKSSSVTATAAGQRSTFLVYGIGFVLVLIAVAAIAGSVALKSNDMKKLQTLERRTRIS